MSATKVTADAILGFVITFGGSLITLLSQEGVNQLADISQGAYVSSFLVAAVATAKLVQSRLAEPPVKPEVLQ